MDLTTEIHIAVTSGEAGPSTAVFGATFRGSESTSRAGHEEAIKRLVSVEEAMNGATEENDEELYLALQFRRISLPRQQTEAQMVRR